MIKKLKVNIYLTNDKTGERLERLYNKEEEVQVFFVNRKQGSTSIIDDQHIKILLNNESLKTLEDYCCCIRKVNKKTVEFSWVKTIDDLNNLFYWS